MRKYCYTYNNNNLTYKTYNINDLIERINSIENLNDNDKLTFHKIHNYFRGKTRKPNKYVSSLSRVMF